MLIMIIIYTWVNLGFWPFENTVTGSGQKVQSADFFPITLRDDWDLGHLNLRNFFTIKPSHLQVIALADLLYLLYVTVYNSCVCLGFTDYPVEVGSKSLATFLG